MEVPQIYQDLQLYLQVVSIADCDRRPPCTSPDRGERACPCPRRSPPLSTRSWSHRRWPRARGSTLNPDAAYVETTRYARRSMTLLASGARLVGLARPRGEHNAELDKCDRVTVDSIRNHTPHATSRSRGHRQSHLPGDPGAAGSGRPGRLRRGGRHGTPAGVTFFEVVMNKAFRDPGGRRHRGQCGDRPARPPRSFSPLGRSTGHERGTEVTRAEGPAGPDQ